jgi:hypothetical protein
MAEVVQMSDYRSQRGAEAEAKPDVEKMKRMFREAEQAHQEARRLAFRDRKYYDNFDDDQWTEAEKRKLRRRRQQIVVSNKIKQKVNGILGYEQRARSDPRAWPRRPDMEKAADIATNVLDFVENKVRADKTLSKAAKDLAIYGIGAVHATMEGEEVVLEGVPFERFFYDPRSLGEDFSDARYMGFCEWMDLDVAKEHYPDHEALLEAQMNNFGGYDEGYEDKPWGVYADEQNQRVRVVVMYYRKANGTWCVSHFTASGVLFDGVSPWPDDEGRPANGIIAQSVYVSQNGQRFGVVRDDIGTQDEINQRKSRSLHLLSDRRTWGLPGWAKDENEAKEALARPDGHVSANTPMGQGWGMIENMSELQGNLELLQQAISDMEVQGIYQPGDSGRAQDQSGRAILALQQAGLTAENHFFDAHNDLKLRVYRRLWSLVRKFWTAEKSIRVTGDNESPRFVELNQPAGVDEFGRPLVRNPVSQIDVDITIEAGPDTMLLQQEQFDMLVGILPQLAQLPLPYAMMIIEASQLRNKKQVMDAMQQFAQMQQPQPDPMQQAMAEAEVNKTTAEAQQKQAMAQKTMVEAAGMYARGQMGIPQ